MSDHTLQVTTGAVWSARVYDIASGDSIHVTVEPGAAYLLPDLSRLVLSAANEEPT